MQRQQQQQQEWTWGDNLPWQHKTQPQKFASFWMIVTVVLLIIISLTTMANYAELPSLRMFYIAPRFFK